MAFYAWTATDAAGKTQRGTLQAEGQKQVRQWLREQKLMPVSITETRETAAGGKAKTGVKLSTPVLSMFTRQLSTLVNAALPLAAVELYGFATFATKDQTGGFFYRRPGVSQLLPVRLADGSIYDPRVSLYPSGFTPQFSGDVVDPAILGGVRGNARTALRSTSPQAGAPTRSATASRTP